MLLKLYSSSLAVWSSLCHCSMGSGSDNRLCPSSELHSPALHWNDLLNPTAKCMPCSFSRGFNNLICLQCLLAAAVYPSCYWALSLTLPSSSTVISAPWSLSWLLQGMGQNRPCLLPFWSLDQCIPQHLWLPALAWIAFGPWLRFLCLMVHGLEETHWQAGQLKKQTSLAGLRTLVFCRFTQDFFV